MNEVAAYDPSTVTRVSLLDVGDVPWSGIDMLDALIDLPPRIFKALGWLRHHLRRYGQLPVGIKALAKIANVGPASFERMVPALDRHFARDSDGRWTDYELLRARGHRPAVAVVEHRVDPVRSAKMAANGARGGQATQARRRERGATETLEPATGPLEVASKGQATHGLGSSKSGKFEANFATSTPENRGANASQADGLSVCLVDFSSKIEEQTDEQTSKSASKAEASERAKPAAHGEANGLASQPMSEAALIKATVQAYGGLVDAAHVHDRLSICREWIAKGCSLDADILPSCREFAAGKTEIRNCFNERVMEKAFKRRDYRVSQGFENTSSADDVFVVEGTPAFRAHLRAKGVRSFFVFQKQDDRTKFGRYFTTEWPPGWDEAKLLEAEASKVPR